MTAKIYPILAETKVSIPGLAATKVTAVEFNRNGSCLVSYSAYDNPPTLRCWNVESGSKQCVKVIRLRSLKQIHSPISHLKHTKLQLKNCANLYNIDYFDDIPLIHEPRNILLQREDGSMTEMDVPENSITALKSIKIKVDKLVKKVGQLIAHSSKYPNDNKKKMIREFEEELFGILQYHNIGIERLNFHKQGEKINIHKGDLVLLTPGKEYENVDIYESYDSHYGYDDSFTPVSNRVVRIMKLFVVYRIDSILKLSNEYVLLNWKDDSYDFEGTCKYTLRDATSHLICDESDILAVMNHDLLIPTSDKYFNFLG